MHVRRYILGIAALLAAVCFATPASRAEAPVKAPLVCTGVDMLAEAETKDPELFRSVNEQAKKLENGEAILWKIEKDGVAPSHLFGTIHISDARVTTMTENVKKALAEAKTVVLEFVGGSDSAMATMMANAGEKLIYTDGRTLENQLTAEEFKQVQALVAKDGMPADVAMVMRPWLINLLLAISDCEKKQMEAGAAALDSKIESDAAAKGQKLAGLETPEEQLDAMTRIPDDQQVQMLKAGLKYADRSQDMLETLVQMYLKRQIGAAMPFNIALAAKHGTPASAYDGFLKILLVDRNVKMRDKALPILDQGGAFIAVGAMHLPGDTGLVKLLRDKGYTVTAAE